MRVSRMTTDERRQFYLAALEDQRHFLRDAIADMGVGDLTRALNVATAIRVLVHKTGNSKPLLKSIQPKYLDLHIPDSVAPLPPDCPPGIKAVTFFCPISAGVSTSGVVSLITTLGSNEYHQSTIGEWWTKACMFLPGIGPVTRRELVPGLANKEGGAHVDAEMPRKYKLLMGVSSSNLRSMK